MNAHAGPTEVPLAPYGGVRFSICTLVTRQDEYREMVASFIQAGFGEADCEFLYIDNSAGNKAEAYAGCNYFLNHARGQYIILCHQDILLRHDRREVLEKRIGELDAHSTDWALLGNAGGVAPGVIAYRLTDPEGEYNSELFPAKVESLDENFILAKREANLSLSHDLQGFHFYGADLCAMARILGWSAWVVDFNLYHKSKGNFSESFYEMSREFTNKYRRALKGREVQTTCMRICLSASPFRGWLSASKRGILFERLYDLRKNAKKNPRFRSVEKEAEIKSRLGRLWYAFFWCLRRVERPLQNLQRYFAIRHWRNSHKLNQTRSTRATTP